MQIQVNFDWLVNVRVNTFDEGHRVALVFHQGTPEQAEVALFVTRETANKLMEQLENLEEPKQAKQAKGAT